MRAARTTTLSGPLAREPAPSPSMVSETRSASSKTTSLYRQSASARTSKPGLRLAEVAGTRTRTRIPQRIPGVVSLELQTLEQPLRSQADRPRVQDDIVVGGDQDPHDHQQDAGAALDNRDERPVALEEAQKAAESEGEGEKRHAEPRRIG